MKKRVAILGAGESGTGAALLAHAKGYDVWVSDNGPIAEKYKLELQASNIPFEEHTHTEKEILNADLIIKSPGIPFSIPIVKKAIGNGLEVIDEIEFAYRFIEGKIIAVTGTNGKTTTTLLTHYMLLQAGFKACVAGNIGDSLARRVLENNSDWYVVEVSSFQLDGCTTFRPDIGVLLNITPDHLDRYEGQMNKYIHAKLKLAKLMDGNGTLVYNADDAHTAAALSNETLKPKTLHVSVRQNSADLFLEDGTIKLNGKETVSVIQQKLSSLQGPHNMINVMCATAVASVAGCEMTAIQEAIKTFKNVSHRMQIAGSIAGIKFINDSKATNLDAAGYALSTFDNPLIWIAGGIDKGNDYALVRDVVRKKVKALICLGKDNTKLVDAFEGVVPVIEETQRMGAAVRLVLDHGCSGDVALLSPACASFDLFKNYEDRGNQFMDAVKKAGGENSTKGMLVNQVI